MRNAYFLSAIYNGESISKLPYSVYEGDSLTEVWFRVAEGYSISGEAKMANGAVLLIMDKHEIEIKGQKHEIDIDALQELIKKLENLGVDTEILIKKDADR